MAGKFAVTDRLLRPFEQLMFGVHMCCNWQIQVFVVLLFGVMIHIAFVLVHAKLNN